MSPLVETIIVAVVVGVALIWGIRAVHRSWKNGGACSSCGDSGDCPLVGKGQELTDLKDIGPDHHCRS